MAQRGQAWSIAVCAPYLSVKNSQNTQIKTTIHTELIGTSKNQNWPKTIYNFNRKQQWDWSDWADNLLSAYVVPRIHA